MCAYVHKCIQPKQDQTRSYRIGPDQDRTNQIRPGQAGGSGVWGSIIIWTDDLHFFAQRYIKAQSDTHGKRMMGNSRIEEIKNAEEEKT